MKKFFVLESCCDNAEDRGRLPRSERVVVGIRADPRRQIIEVLRLTPVPKVRKFGCPVYLHAIASAQLDNIDRGGDQCLLRSGF